MCNEATSKPFLLSDFNIPLSMFDVFCYSLKFQEILYFLPFHLTNRQPTNSKARSEACCCVSIIQFGFKVKHQCYSSYCCYNLHLHQSGGM